MTWTPDDYKRLGQQVRAARRRAGFTDREAFAEAVGVTARVLADLEAGKLGARKHGFSPDTFYAIEEGLNWPVGACEAILNGASGPEAMPGDDEDVVTVAIDRSQLSRADKAELKAHYYRLLDRYGQGGGEHGSSAPR